MTNTQFYKLSLIPIIYFIILYSLYVFKISSVLIGVFIELFTLPMMGILAFAFIYSLIRLGIKKNRTNLSYIATLQLCIATSLVIGSFFW
ncbi:MAG: hypothetical protein CL817_02955 [Croceibacter sp.]|nr:hypothetical protein [Croceibacter sp.]